MLMGKICLCCVLQPVSKYQLECQGGWWDGEELDIFIYIYGVDVGREGLWTRWTRSVFVFVVPSSQCQSQLGCQGGWWDGVGEAAMGMWKN